MIFDFTVVGCILVFYGARRSLFGLSTRTHRDLRLLDFLDCSEPTFFSTPKTALEILPRQRIYRPEHSGRTTFALHFKNQNRLRLGTVFLH